MMNNEINAVAAQAELHHQYFLGLQLMVAVEESRQVVYDWMFSLFRRQHEEKFLSSFAKLGLNGLPHAVACAKYHVLSNGVGGVVVEYMPESDTKAWVRFRYPRWMYAGPAICGIPVEASRGFLDGWYAHNGVSLNNPRLGFVCVSEDVTGQFGLCGYFKEYSRDLAPEERPQFVADEPYRILTDAQPSPLDNQWNEERLAKANRNYALNTFVTESLLWARLLVPSVLKPGVARARLIGLQHYPVMARQVGAVDGGVQDAAVFLQSMMRGMGDTCSLTVQPDGSVIVLQRGLRILRGLDSVTRQNLLGSWIELWRGAIHSHRAFMDLHCEGDAEQPDTLLWTVRPATVS